jgi:hypothetical protein
MMLNITPLLVYRFLFAASFVNVLIGTYSVVDPVWFANSVGVEPTIAWAAWGGMLIATYWLFLPGLLDPLGERWVSWSSIGIKFAMACLWAWLGSEFWRFAAWDAAWGAALLVSYSLALRQI